MNIFLVMLLFGYIDLMEIIIMILDLISYIFGNIRIFLKDKLCENILRNKCLLLLI